MINEDPKESLNYMSLSILTPNQLRGLYNNTQNKGATES